MKKYLPYIIVVNIVWAISSLVYDLPAIAHVPFYLWPFIVICPIFPTFLAITWWQIFRYNKANNYLLAFSALPSVIYFLGALIFYPTKMILSGFNLLDFGQIFWVAVYGSQGLYLLKKYSSKKLPAYIVTAFLIISFMIQYLTKTYDYLDFSNIPSSILFGGYLFLSLILILSNIFNKKLNGL